MRTCAHCGTSIEGYRPQARRCGPPCRAAASRARKAAEASARVERPRRDQTPQNRTQRTTETVAWESLPPAEQHRIESLLSRHADLVEAA